jgi:phosphatidylserine/phosphatidylglycerophosphate/cardiolipin synthase-like enzyme
VILTAIHKRAGLVLLAVVLVWLLTCPVSKVQAATQSRASTGGLSVIVEPSRLGSVAGMQPVYAFVLSARLSVDMTMYELEDQAMVSDLLADQKRGVKVRVILDTNREHSRNLHAFDSLRAGGVKVVWAPTNYEATHQKTITVDRARSLIFTANLTSQYYTTTRDFGIFDSNPADVAAIEAVFNADFAHVAITPVHGADLIWSPGSQSEMLAVIDGGAHTLSIENEEMGDAAITRAIAAAAGRGVTVELTMTADSSYDSDFDEIVHAGGRVHLYADDYSDLYIHAKTTIADAGRNTERIYLGSINFSSASMDRNRELGIVTTNPTIVGAVNAVVNSDFSKCTAATDCRSYG